MTRQTLERLFERVRRGCPWATRELVSRETQAWVAHHCRGFHYDGLLSFEDARRVRDDKTWARR